MALPKGRDASSEKGQDDYVDRIVSLKERLKGAGVKQHSLLPKPKTKFESALKSVHAFAEAMKGRNISGGDELTEATGWVKFKAAKCPFDVEIDARLCLGAHGRQPSGGIEQ